MPTALISVSDKTRLDSFAQELRQRGFELLASGGTCKAIQDAGIPVQDVADVIGHAQVHLVSRWLTLIHCEEASASLPMFHQMIGQPILNHRVVTLSREVFAGVLARYVESDRKELEELGVPYIDLVVVDLYHLGDAINLYRENKMPALEVIEKIDVGGPSLLGAAAKAGRMVLSLESQRASFLKWLDDGKQNEKCYLLEQAAQAHLVASRHLHLASMFWSLCCQTEKC